MGIKYNKLIRLSLLLLLPFISLGAKEKTPPAGILIANEQPGYTINFQDVSILEFLKFITQISDTNFIYDEAEMNFNVTITSEEPTSLSNIMAALIQVLRIQGFEMMEQGPNIILHKNPAVKQIATVVSEEIPYEGPYPLPMATRVFRIHSNSPTRLSLLLKPMLSATAIVEPSEETSHLIVTDNTANVKKVEELLQSLDTINNQNIFLYKLQYKGPFVIDAALKKISKSFQVEGQEDIGLVNAVKSMKYIDESNSFLFVGDQEALKKIEDLLKTLDSAGKPTISVFVYRPKYKSVKEVEKGLERVADNLKNSRIVEIDLLFTLKNMQVNKKAGIILFMGDEAALTQLKNLLPTIDAPSIEQAVREKAGEANEFLIYNPQHRPGKVLLEAIDQLADDLKDSELADPSMLYALESVKWEPKNNALVFTGTETALLRVKEVMSLIDFDVAQTGVASHFYLYKPKFKPPKQIQRNLNHIAEDLKRANLADPGLLNAIKSMRFESSSNSLVFTGNTDTIEKIKELLAEVDVPKEREEMIHKLGPVTFLVYTPVNLSADQLMRSLRAIGAQIADSGRPDEGLVQSIKTMRYVEETKSIIFTGPEPTLEKLETLLHKFDTPVLGAAIQKIGKSTFFVYQPRYVTVEQLMASLETISRDLERSADPDQQLIETINRMRYVQDSKSLVFTGPEPTLEKVQRLIEKFDNPALATTGFAGPEGYVLYTPKFQHGENLIETLRDFEKNLVQAGVNQKQLFDAINSLKWMEKTCSILISGTQSAIQEVETLLARFDIPIAGETEIETIDDVSFLIYKLQYHRGDQIEIALKKVATDLQETQTSKLTSPTAKPASVPSSNATDLIEAINSIQWLEITNSLIGTGKPQVLAKLKELLKSLDSPLRQVFIEVLVVQTTLQNDLSLGLRWGSQGKYRNKLGYATGSFPSLGGTDAGGDPAADFNKNLAATSASDTPTGQDIPFLGGWDLGVIGDIIMHKGQSYFALGSLVNALKEDGDTTIILTQQIITQDGKNSTLFTGVNLPFSGSLVTNAGASTLTTSNIEYIDIGITLSITPTLGEDDIVTLQIDEEITAQIEDASDAGSSGGSSDLTTVATGIATSKNTTTTTVAVPDRHFLVLSGSMTNSTVRSRQSIPCLGGLPIVGVAFQNKDSNISKSNVIMFVKPQIIHSFHEYDKITEERENLWRDYSVPEEFDQAIDLIKTPEDLD
ncbi:MAG: hypothetical protein SNF33_05100 [Candidatus Algichlamydia australiensis]|nr:hypothetical protein [Chlamydiales bacterium]